MDYFKLPYFLFPFKFHRELKSNIVKGIENQESGPYDDISDTDWSLDDAPYFEIFSSQFVDEVDKHFSQFNIGKWVIGKVWYQRYIKTNSHYWHKHGKSHWTCVYYVNLPVDAPGTVIKDPYTNQIIELKIKEGDIFIFPSQIFHCSPPNQSNEEKLIISLNIDADT